VAGRVAAGRLAEQDAAECAVRALWREVRADRLEARILGDLFAADMLAEEAERRAAKALAMRALATLLRYRAQIAREYSAAMHDLDLLRRRRLAAERAVQRAELMPVPANDAPVQDEPERPLNRPERRALAAMQRKRVA
jgi:hypothetical protein